MRIEVQKLLQLKSWHKRQASLYKRWKGSLMLMPSWMNTHDGNLMDSIHHPFLLYKMFLHAAANGRKEHDHAIHWSWWQPSPERDLEAELWRSSGKSPCDAKMEQRVWQDILDFIKEHLWHRWEHAQPEERLRQSPTGTSRPDPWVKAQDRVCAMYNHLEIWRKGHVKKPWP